MAQELFNLEAETEIVVELRNPETSRTEFLVRVTLYSGAVRSRMDF